MSQENVESVRASFEAYLRGDVAAALTLFDEDAVYKRAEEAAVKGREAVRASWARWEADWQELETIPEEFIDAGDRVVIPVLFRGRGRTSGVVVEDRFYEVVTLRHGKCIYWEEFADRDRAFAAAGLSE